MAEKDSLTQVGTTASQNFIGRYKNAVETVLKSPMSEKEMDPLDEKTFYDTIADGVRGGRWIRIKAGIRYNFTFRRLGFLLRGAILFPKLLIALGEEFKRLQQQAIEQEPVVKIMERGEECKTETSAQRDKS